MKKIWKEPLLHFIVIGAALFGLYVWLNPETLLSDRRIVVDQGQIESMVATFSRTWNRTPNAQEIKALIDNYVEEEIYYRQAMEMGIDKNDAVIRRRLQQKMEFITSDLMGMMEVTDEELQSYLEQNAGKFAYDPVYSFEQVYINTDRPVDEVNNRIAELKSKLAAGEIINGDQTMLPETVDNFTAFQVDRIFGTGFSIVLDALTVDQWSEPARSGLGLHLIRLSQRQEGGIPELDAVRPQVERDLLNEKNQQVRTNLLNSMLEDYEVVIQWSAEEKGS